MSNILLLLIKKINAYIWLDFFYRFFYFSYKNTGFLPLNPFVWLNCFLFLLKFNPFLASYINSFHSSKLSSFSQTYSSNFFTFFFRFKYFCVQPDIFWSDTHIDLYIFFFILNRFLYFLRSLIHTIDKLPDIIHCFYLFLIPGIKQLRCDVFQLFKISLKLFHN